jgi:hypothetical protein
MASGHVNRANRPNTWLLRPMLQMKILLANPEPSTHGPSRHFAPHVNYVALGAKPWQALQPLCPNALTGPE